MAAEREAGWFLTYEICVLVQTVCGVLICGRVEALVHYICMV